MKEIVRSLITVVFIVLIALAFYDVPLDFYLLPVSACGIVTLSKALTYYKELVIGKHKLVFFLYCSLFFSTFLAPLIHFSINHWMLYMYLLPLEWEPWVFIFGIENFIGIVLFGLVYEYFFNRPSRFTNGVIFSFRNPNNIQYVYIIGFICFATQIYVFIKFGGITGYIAAFDERDSDMFSGMGLLFIISEFFPSTLILIYFLKAKTNPRLRQKSVIYIFLLVLFIVALFFGGMRGSRANTLYTLLHAIILIHLFYNKFNIKEIAVGLFFLMLFMYVGKLYKQGGSSAVIEYSEGNLDEESSRYKFSTIELLVQDFARADVQSYLIYRYDNYEYQPKYGITYLGDMLSMIPDIIYDYDGTDKVSAGTELQYGKYSDLVGKRSTRIYGFLGQYILNFGYLTAFLSYIPLAFILVYLDKWLGNLEKDDIRYFFFPILIFFVILLFNSDVDNIVRFASRRFLLAFFLIYLISDRMRYKNV